MGIIFKQTAEKESVLGKNFRLHSTTFRSVSMGIFVQEDGLFPGLVNKREGLKTFL